MESLKPIALDWVLAYSATMLTRCSLADVLSETETILPEQQRSLARSITFSNEAEFDAKWAEYLLNVPYAAREVRINALRLGQLPTGTKLTGEHHFLMQVGEAVVAEYIPHALRVDDNALRAALNVPPDTLDLAEECLLLARYGHSTWGHWLGEILPIAATVECLFPRRFQYAIAGYSDKVASYQSVVEQSLAAYGISADRLIRLRQDRAHRLARAWAVTPIWSDSVPHPAAITVMRGAVATVAHGSGIRKLVLARKGTRELANETEILDILRAEGFVLCDMTRLSFIDQVCTFRNVETIVSVIGSGLTGLIYAPDHVRVLGIGPARFGDAFFYTLGQLRNAKWAEVRGLSFWKGEGLERDAPFEISPSTFRTALAMLR